jgi:hypothetical protein
LWNAVGLKTKTEGGAPAVGWVDEFGNRVVFSYAVVHMINNTTKNVAAFIRSKTSDAIKLAERGI